MPFFLREALRSLGRNAMPSFAAMATVLVTMLVLGVFIPIVQATTGAANEVRGRLLLDVYLKTDATAADVERVRQKLVATPNVKRVEYVSKQDAYQAERKRNPEAYQLLGANPLPDTFRVTPDQPGHHRRAARRAGPGLHRRRAGGHRHVDRPGQEPPRRDGQDPVGHARGEADHGPAGRAADQPPRCC